MIDGPSGDALREALEQIDGLVMVAGNGFMPDSCSYLRPDQYYARVKAICRVALSAVERAHIEVGRHGSGADHADAEPPK